MSPFRCVTLMFFIVAWYGQPVNRYEYAIIRHGEMSERLKELVLKTSVLETVSWVRIPLSPPSHSQTPVINWYNKH